MIFFFFFWNTGFKCFQMGDLSSSLLELVRIISGVLNAPDKGTVSAVKICIHYTSARCWKPLKILFYVLFAVIKNVWWVWPGLLLSPAGTDPSLVHSLQPTGAHSCTTWLQARGSRGLRIARWLRSQPEGSPSLTQHRAGASGWARLLVCTFREDMISVWFIQNSNESLLNSSQSQLAWDKQIFFARQCFGIWSSVYVAELCRWVTVCLLTINTEENTLLVLPCWVGGCANILPCIF